MMEQWNIGILGKTTYPIFNSSFVVPFTHHYSILLIIFSLFHNSSIPIFQLFQTLILIRSSAKRTSPLKT